MLFVQFVWDAEPVHIADDQQRRVFQSQGILLKLGEGGIQVLSLALGFPAKVIPLPYVCPALAAGGFGGAALERVPLARWIGVRGRRFVQQPAQVNKMGMGRRPFFQFGGLPFSDELIGGHRRGHSLFGGTIAEAQRIVGRWNYNLDNRRRTPAQRRTGRTPRRYRSRHPVRFTGWQSRVYMRLDAKQPIIQIFFTEEIRGTKPGYRLTSRFNKHNYISGL
jgi:hypothetical protein